MLIYSGHDTTLVPVLSALGLYDGKFCVYYDQNRDTDCNYICFRCLIRANYCVRYISFAFFGVDTWPPYASHLAVEIASKKNDPRSLFVRAVFNNQEMSMFHDPSTVWCPIEKFWNHLETSAVSPQQFEDACNQVIMSEQEGKESQDGQENDIDDSADVEMTAKEVEREVAETITKHNNPPSGHA